MVAKLTSPRDSAGGGEPGQLIPSTPPRHQKEDSISIPESLAQEECTEVCRRGWRQTLNSDTHGRSTKRKWSRSDGSSKRRGAERGRRIASKIKSPGVPSCPEPEVRELPGECQDLISGGTQGDVSGTCQEECLGMAKAGPRQ